MKPLLKYATSKEKAYVRIPKQVDGGKGRQDRTGTGRVSSKMIERDSGHRGCDQWALLLLNKGAGRMEGNSLE